MFDAMVLLILLALYWAFHIWAEEMQQRVNEGRRAATISRVRLARLRHQQRAIKEQSAILAKLQARSAQLEKNLIAIRRDYEVLREIHQSSCEEMFDGLGETA